MSEDVSEPVIKRLPLGDSGHHVPSVRKSKGRPFEVDRSDKTRPTLFPKGNDLGNLHWCLHEAERKHIGPRQGDFDGTDEELFTAYRLAYADLDNILVDVRSPDGSFNLGENVTPRKAIDLIETWLKNQGLWQTENEK
jgi:hypothetical protein